MGGGHRMRPRMCQAKRSMPAGERFRLQGCWLRLLDNAARITSCLSLSPSASQHVGSPVDAPLCLDLSHHLVLRTAPVRDAAGTTPALDHRPKVGRLQVALRTGAGGLLACAAELIVRAEYKQTTLERGVRYQAQQRKAKAAKRGRTWQLRT